MLPHKINENADKNYQNKLFMTLEINQKLAIIWGALIKKKKKMAESQWEQQDLWSFYLPYSCFSPHCSVADLKSDGLASLVAVKTSIPETNRKGRTGLVLPKGPIPRESSLCDLSSSSLESSAPFSETVFIWPDSELAQ